ncbi:histidine triad (HIT) family protein [Curtobacterium sp. 314Chir4.1]|nr:histidine triad (HIT) family protein [Curtobacterium sp. 314Chir4.1]
MGSECPFCVIVAQNDPDVREVYRDEHVVAFFPDEPATLGHVLVIPRSHVPKVWELSDDTATHLTRAVLLLSRAVKHALEPSGLNLIQSNGESATQSVPHLHVHVVPRNEGDAMGRIWPRETSFSEAVKNKAMLDVRHAIEREAHEASVPVTPEDRRKHLDYLQAVVTRQAASSAAAKGWVLPVVTATYGFALTQRAWPLAFLGLLGLLLFAYLDAHYLNTERRFRKLYVIVAQSLRSVPLFTLNPDDADDPVEEDSDGSVNRWQRLKRKYVPGRDIWYSWSIAPFYGALALLGVGVIVAVIWRYGLDAG